MTCSTSYGTAGRAGQVPEPNDPPPSRAVESGGVVLSSDGEEVGALVAEPVTESALHAAETPTRESSRTRRTIFIVNPWERNGSGVAPPGLDVR